MDNIRNLGYNSITTGDFNYNLINYQYHEDTQTFYNILTSGGFQPTVTKPTRINNNTATLLDHIWTNYNVGDDTFNTHILVTDITDHLHVLYIDKGSKIQTGYTNIRYRQINDRNKEYFLNDLIDNDNKLKLLADDPMLTADKNYTKYMIEFTKIYNKHFPMRTKKFTTRYWRNPGLHHQSKGRSKIKINYFPRN